MDFFAPSHSIAALAGAAILGYVIGYARGSAPGRRRHRARSELESRASTDQAYARLNKDTRERIATLARRGAVLDAVRLVRKEIGCGLKDAKGLVDRLRESQ